MGDGRRMEACISLRPQCRTIGGKEGIKKLHFDFERFGLRYGKVLTLPRKSVIVAQSMMRSALEEPGGADGE